MNNKFKLGTLFEINTPKGKAYIHYIHYDTKVGELVRVLPGLYKTRPSNIDELVERKERFFVFFPISAAHRQKIIDEVGHSNIPVAKPTHMRSKHTVRGEFRGWHIINTDTWERQLVPELSETQRHLSAWGIWNDTLLIKRIAEEWSPEEWC